MRTDTLTPLVVSPSGRRYGALISRPDPRDLGFPHRLLEHTPLPTRDEQNFIYAPAVKDQGEEGSCTAHGGCSNTEFLYHRYLKRIVTLSPQFPYYMERFKEGTLKQGDVGAQVRTSLYTMNRYGAPLLSDAPYISGDIDSVPTPEILAKASQQRVGAYHRLSTVWDVKCCIHSGYTIVIGMTVCDSFESIGADGLMPMPKHSERILGGHEVFGGLIYDDTMKCPGASPGAVLMQNSWGERWGWGGRFWMPYDYLADRDYVSDIWMQHLGKSWQAVISQASSGPSNILS